MKTICAMQPYLFPYLPYYQLAGMVDEFWLLDDVQFIRRGWMNRNRILLNGAEHVITFPVASGARADLIADKALAAGFDQALLRLKTTLHHAYHAAPHGMLIDRMMDRLTARHWRGYLEFSLETLRLSFDALSLATPLRLTSVLGLSPDLRGPDRILAICRAAGAERYVNPIGGRGLYDPAHFGAQGIQLRFLAGQCAPYAQTGGQDFRPGLSILDLIAHVAPPDLKAHLGNARLRSL